MDMTIQPDNPAGRLYLILKEMQKGINQQWPMRDVIAKYFDIDPDNSDEWLFAYIGLRNLVITTQEYVKRLSVSENDKMLYLEPVGEIKSALNPPNLFSQWSGIGDKINNALSDLRFVSSVLSNSSLSEAVVTDQELEALQTEVESLLDEMRSSQLPDDFKLLLIDKLVEIHRAVRYYPMNGVESLKEALEHAFGAIMLAHVKIINLTQDNEEARDKYKKFEKILNELFKIVATISVKELAEAAIPQIPLLLDKLQ